ncbi:MAG: radical SAM protein [Opitutae bacterium]|nr:radical SAM protein [Opitutae bacterium]
MSLAAKRALRDPLLSRAEQIYHARRFNRELRQRELQLGATTLQSWPAYMDLSVAGKCNLRCEMCGLTHGDPTHPNWTFAEVERFSAYYPYLDTVNPTGAGEPMLVKELPAMLELFKRHGNAVGFYTNGTLLTSEKIDLLIRLGIDNINISFDGATRETFERIRHPAKFDRVLANIRNLIKRRRELGAKQPAVRLAMVLMNDNKHELPALIQLAAELGVEGVFTMFVSDRMPLQMPQKDPIGTNACLREATAVAQKLGLHFYSPGLLPETSDSASAPVTALLHSGLICTHPWMQLLVWNNGDVSPCCRIQGKLDGHDFGNANTTSPELLWNSPGFVHLRQRIAANDAPQVCQTCPLRTAKAN